jgi:hypothetical protein
MEVNVLPTEPVKSFLRVPDPGVVRRAVIAAWAPPLTSTSKAASDTMVF